MNKEINLSPTWLQEIIVSINTEPLTDEKKESIIRCLGYQIPKAPLVIAGSSFCRRCKKILQKGIVYCNCGYKVDWSNVVLSPIDLNELANDLLRLYYDIDTYDYGDAFGSFDSEDDFSSAMEETLSSIATPILRIGMAVSMLEAYFNMDALSDYEQDIRERLVSIIDKLVDQNEQLCYLLPLKNLEGDERKVAIFTFLWKHMRKVFLSLSIPSNYQMEVKVSFSSSCWLWPKLSDGLLTFDIYGTGVLDNVRNIDFVQLYRLLLAA